MKEKSIRIHLASILVVSATCTLAQETWTGLGADNLWSTANNWADTSAPSGVVAGGLTFSGTTRTTNQNDISGLSFTLLTLNDSAWNISGNSFTIAAASGNIISIGAATTPTVANDLTITGTGNRTIQTQNTAGGSLTLSGSLTATGLEIRKDGGGSNVIFNGSGKTVSLGTYNIRKGATTFTNGVTFNGTALWLGSDATFSGTDPSMTVSGTGTTVTTTGDFQIGRAANDGRLNVSGGTVNAFTLFTGQAASSLATSGVYQTGGIINATRLRASDNGASTIDISAGQFNVLEGQPNSTTFGLTRFGTTILNLAGTGEVNIQNGLSKWNLAAGNGTGTINLNGGTLFCNGFSKQVTTGITTINLNGGTLKSGGNAGNWFSDLDNTDVNVGNGGAIIDTNGFTITIAEPLLGDGTGGLTKNGSGELTLDGACTYTGNTVINAGTLKLGSAGTIATSPLIDIKAGAIFKTTDSVPETETSFTMTAGQPFKITLNPTDDGTAGRIDAEALNISAGIMDFATTGPLNDPVYIIANYTSLSGTQFATVTNLPDGYTLEYDHNTGTQIALVADVVPGYASWATANDIEGELPEDDFDNDGITNLVEYALGKNPKVSDLPPGAFDGSTLTFTKGADALANGDVAYSIEESDDLGIAAPWADVVATEVGNTISYNLPTGKTRVFARLKAVLTTP
jgi:autotransporter-associated beta strand protein